MVSCKHCQTPNSLDSTFCKRCGTPVIEADLKEAQAKLEKLVEEGNALFNAGRTDEALAIAEAAVLANPSSTNAWSLKTLCHERRGEIAEALECADRLVELNPDSDFDKIRRSTLRQKLQTDLHVPAAPDRRLALVGAFSAVVLVLCAGAILARITNGNGATAQHTPTTQSPLSNPELSATPQLTNPGPVTSSTPNPGTQPNNAVTNPETGAGSQVGRDPSAVPPLREGNTPRNTGSEIHLPDAPKGELPRPIADGDNTEIRPLQPNVPDSISQGGAAQGNTGGPTLPTKTAQNTTQSIDPDTLKASAPETKKEDDPGFIEIKTHSGGSSSPRIGGGSEPISGNGLETLVRVGSQQFQLGNYAAAAKSYEQAVRNGGDAIILNRRLAQAYERLGRSSDAADAYRRCITAIDSSLAAGRGNKDSLNSTRDLCQQALKVIQGG